MHPLDNEALKLGAKAVRRRRLDAEIGRILSACWAALW